MLNYALRSNVWQSHISNHLIRGREVGGIGLNVAMLTLQIGTQSEAGLKKPKF